MKFYIDELKANVQIFRRQGDNVLVATDDGLLFESPIASLQPLDDKAKKYVEDWHAFDRELNETVAEVDQEMANKFKVTP